MAEPNIILDDVLNEGRVTMSDFPLHFLGKWLQCSALKIPNEAKFTISFHYPKMGPRKFVLLKWDFPAPSEEADIVLSENLSLATVAERMVAESRRRTPDMVEVRVKGGKKKYAAIHIGILVKR